MSASSWCPPICSTQRPWLSAGAVRFQRIDVLCNIGGGFRMGKPVHETPENVWELMLDLNAKS